MIEVPPPKKEAPGVDLSSRVSHEKGRKYLRSIQFEYRLVLLSDFRSQLSKEPQKVLIFKPGLQSIQVFFVHLEGENVYFQRDPLDLPKAKNLAEFHSETQDLVSSQFVDIPIPPDEYYLMERRDQDQDVLPSDIERSTDPFGGAVVTHQHWFISDQVQALLTTHSALATGASQSFSGECSGQ